MQFRRGQILSVPMPSICRPFPVRPAHDDGPIICQHELPDNLQKVSIYVCFPDLGIENSSRAGGASRHVEVI